LPQRGFGWARRDRLTNAAVAGWFGAADLSPLANCGRRNKFLAVQLALEKGDGPSSDGCIISFAIASVARADLG
jgi:hypothetical protein